MLRSFGLSNFRSFDLDSTDSNIVMTKGPSRTKSEHMLYDDLLRISVIYGSNAAGKSNLIKGLRTVKDLITNIDNLNDLSEEYCKVDIRNDEAPTTFYFEIECNDEQNMIEYDQDRGYIPTVNESLFKTEVITYTYIIELSFKYPGHPHIISESIFRGDDEICSKNSVDDPYSTLSETSILDKTYRDLRQRQSKLLKEYYQSIRNTSFVNSGQNEEPIMEAEFIIDSIHKDMPENVRLELEHIKEKIRTNRSEYSRINRSVKNSRCTRSFITSIPDIDRLRTEGVILNSNAESVIAAISSIYRWFNQTLEIIDPYGFTLPSVESDSLEELSSIIKDFDVGVKRIDWERITDRGLINKIFVGLNNSDAKKVHACHMNSIREKIECSTVVGDISQIYRVSFWNGHPTIKKLITYHDDGKSFDLAEESDGTKRIIELASILLDNNDEKVFVIDELDRRLHPLLTKYFINRYLEDNRKNKQLLIATHETCIMTTDIFRRDEIWFATHDEYGRTHLKRLTDMDIDYTHHLDQLYLKEKVFGGIPEINDLTDLYK